MRKTDRDQEGTGDDYIDINFTTSAGMLGNRLAKIQIKKDQDHPSNQFNRASRRRLEIGDFPDWFVVLTVRMAASTFVTSISIELIKQDKTGDLVWIIGIFIASFLCGLWFYCARAIHSQPNLKWGVLHLWAAIVFGAVLGAIL